MILNWLIYYLILIIICYSLTKIISNKFLKFFSIPIIFGTFGSFWFIEPGSSEIAPIISIIFLESSILESNGFGRLLRPTISFIFLLQFFSMAYYFYTNKVFKR